MMRTETTRYWLIDGTETCLLCGHVHVLQMEYRCAGCDRGVCEQCVLVVRERHEVLCVECHAEDEAGS